MILGELCEAAELEAELERFVASSTAPVGMVAARSGMSGRVREIERKMAELPPLKKGWLYRHLSSRFGDFLAFDEFFHWLIHHSRPTLSVVNELSGGKTGLGHLAFSTLLDEDEVAQVTGRTLCGERTFPLSLVEFSAWDLAAGKTPKAEDFPGRACRLCLDIVEGLADKRTVAAHEEEFSRRMEEREKIMRNGGCFQ